MFKFIQLSLKQELKIKNSGTESQSKQLENLIWTTELPKSNKNFRNTKTAKKRKTWQNGFKKSSKLNQKHHFLIQMVKMAFKLTTVCLGKRYKHR